MNRATKYAAPRMKRKKAAAGKTRSAAAVSGGTKTRRRQGATAFRGKSAGLRAATAALRREARQAAGEAAVARVDLEQLMAQVREANSRLIVNTVRAQIMTEEAEQANQLKDEFLATVSHELRTPLNAVLGWARMLGSMNLPPARVKHGIAVIERNASALAHLIEDLLDVSRIVAGTLRLAPQPIDLVAVAQSALETVGPLALAGNVKLAFSPDRRELEPVSGDAGRIQQVIGNLVANAIKFTPAGGRVDIFITRAGGEMEIKVVDTGQGISADFLPYVFDRFRQADGAPTRRHSGLGVGLAIVRQLVELHGGTVSASSPGPDLGATFIVRLPISGEKALPDDPVAAEKRRGVPPGSSPTPRLPRLDSLRILVVDDDADGRALTSMFLSQAGATVDAVGSAREALQILDEKRPDAIVSDIRLPDEDGYRLIRQVRQHEAERGGFTPAVALTGYARAEDRELALAAGFQAHVSKPVDPVELAAVVAASLRSSKAGPRKRKSAR